MGLSKQKTLHTSDKFTFYQTMDEVPCPEGVRRTQPHAVPELNSEAFCHAKNKGLSKIVPQNIKLI